MQGNIINHNFTNSRVVGETQELYQGDDGGGGYVEYYRPDGIPIRCKTYSIPVKQNTDYSIRVFNSSYNDIEFYTCYYSAPGTITPTVSSMTPYAKKSIPGNSTFVAADEQWTILGYSHWRNNATEWWVNTYALPVDVRPLLYEFCDHYATLKAGTYKVMIDAWTNHVSNGYVGFNPYTGCVYDNANYTDHQGNEWFALLEEDNTTILAKQDILPNVTTRSKKVEDGPPYPNYFHNEVTFTIDHDCKVGLFHRAHYHTPSTNDPAYFRFMIVDPDVEAQYFETTGVYGTQQSGYSAWEKYQVTLPVMVSCADQSQIITFDLDDFLYSDDTISKSSTGIDIPTYAGITDISLMCEAAPTEMYIRYNKGSIGMYCTICGYGGESKAVCPRCGATGYDLLDIPAMAQGPMYAPDELDLIRDEIGFTNPNLHRRAELHIDGNHVSIDYPDSVEVSMQDFKIEDINNEPKITEYTGTEQNIKIPDISIDLGVKTLGAGTFTDTDVVYVEIPEGITTIE